MKIYVFFKSRDYFQYDLDWRDAFLSQKEVEVAVFDLGNLTSFLSFKKIIKADWLILLHSVDPSYQEIQISLLKKILKHRQGKVVYFPRNEYKNFSLKRKFIKEFAVELVASQLPLKAALYLYGDLTRLISLSHGLNSDIYQSKKPISKRPIFIGGRSVAYPLILLDDDRNRLLNFINRFKNLRPQARIDYSLKISDRFDRKGWSRFLNRCRFTLATEAGSSYLDKTDRLQKQVETYIEKYPKVSIEELRKIFQKRVEKLPSGKCISSRHFEAIGCQTCQILLEGNYSGILKADEHYIELKKDFSNFELVIEKINNKKLVNQIIEKAYELVRTNHTYEQRVRTLVTKMARLD